MGEMALFSVSVICFDALVLDMLLRMIRVHVTVCVLY